MNESDAEKQFAGELAKRGLSHCPKCGRKIDRADVAWNSGETEFGTPHSSVEIQCIVCQTEIGHWNSWHGDIESFEDLVENVLVDWEPLSRQEKTTIISGGAIWMKKRIGDSVSVGIPNEDWKKWTTIKVNGTIPENAKIISIGGEVFENRTRRIRELKDYLLGLMDV